MRSSLVSLFPRYYLALFALGLLACTADERDFSSGGGGGAGGAGGAGGEASVCSSPADCPAGFNEAATCLEGKCGVVCNEGFADCSESAGGCETIATTKENCGACGVTCATNCSAQSGQAPFCNDPIDISAGFHHTCVIRTDGTVWCWGSNIKGEIGVSDAPMAVHIPMKVDLPGKAIKVAAGGGYGASTTAHTCVILEDTTVYCWGNGDYGQLGIGGSISSPIPQQVTSLVNMVDLAAGARHTCAVKKDGDLYCWGSDDSGQLGNGAGQVDLANPGLILSGVKQVDTGEKHTCAVMLNGSLKCWGSNFEGALGTGDAMDREAPADSAAPLTDGVEEVAVGDRHTCARRGEEVYCFGNDYNGACGTNSFGPVHNPTLVAVPQATHVAVGRERSGAVSGPEGLVRMWGVPVLGTGDGKSSTTPVAAQIEGVARIAGGYEHTCVLKTNGEVWCWGEDALGELGDGPQAATQVVPVQVVSGPPG